MITSLTSGLPTLVMIGNHNLIVRSPRQLSLIVYVQSQQYCTPHILNDAGHAQFELWLIHVNIRAMGDPADTTWLDKLQLRSGSSRAENKWSNIVYSQSAAVTVLRILTASGVVCQYTIAGRGD